MRWGVVVVVLASCAKEPHEAEDKDSLTIDELAAAYHDAMCAHWIACGVVADRATCDLPNVAVIELDARFIDAIHDGRTAWDGVAARACVDALATGSCDSTTETSMWQCYRPTGLLDDGEACMVATECVSNECWNERCAEACCAGTCVGSTAPEPSGIGGQCRTTYCAEGRCDGTLCQPFLALGDTCSRVGDCADDLACLNRVCSAIPDRGEPCTRGVGSTCRMLGDRCSSITQRCEPAGFAGAVCREDEECASFHICANRRCTLERVPLGASCSYTDLCADEGAVCSFDGCILPRAAGEPCNLYFECESGICNYDTSTCTTLDGCL